MVDDWLRITYKRPLGRGEHVSMVVFSPQTVRGMWRGIPTVQEYVGGSLILFAARMHEEGTDVGGYRILCIRGGFDGACIDRWSDPIVIQEAQRMGSA